MAIANDQAAIAASRCERLTELFGDRLYVELQRHGLEIERRAEGALIDLAYAKGLPLVATNEPLFADRRRLRSARCAGVHRRRAAGRRNRSSALHAGSRFKTRAEMAVLFADIPEALASTVEIAQRCSYRPLTRKPILPRFTVGGTASAAEAETAEASELRRQAEEGLAQRLATARLRAGHHRGDTIASGSPSSSA